MYITSECEEIDNNADFETLTLPMCGLVIWRQLILKYGGQVTDALDLSCLARISDGYTQGHMVRVVRSIMTERRIQLLAKKPLAASEFIGPLAKIDPIFQDEEEALKVKMQTPHVIHF